MSGNAVAYSDYLSAPAKFDRKQFFPEARRELVTEFLSLFHRYNYIYKPLTEGSWLSAKSEWRLTDSEILKAAACHHPKFYLGCRAAKSSRFAVLDIDAGSRYHNIKEVGKLTKVLNEAGMVPGALYRSSFSDGWHLYIYFLEPISSRDLRKQLINLLTLHDYSIAKGSLEVFPHPGEGSEGQGLRLPLQPGWAWLDMETAQVIEDRADLSPLEAVCRFLNDLNGDANSYNDFRNFKTYVEKLALRREAIAKLTRQETRGANVIPIKRVDRSHIQGEYANQVRSIFGATPPGINADVWYKGRRYYQSGLTAASQRADAVFALSHYFFYGDPSRSLPALGYGCEDERQWAITEVLAHKHNGLSKDINRGRPEAQLQIQRAANWRPPHKRGVDQKPYEDKVPISWKRANANKQVAAIGRIKDAVTRFIDRGHYFSIRDLIEAAKTSQKTLYKHQDIWKPAQERLNRDRFAAVSHKYNAVEGGVAAETPPLARSSLENMPPGRLAARRIVYEISSRARREQRLKSLSVQSENQTWKQSVDNADPKELETSSSEHLKASLVVLIHLQELAPSYEDLAYIQKIIRRLRSELEGRGLISGLAPP